MKIKKVLALLVLSIVASFFPSFATAQITVYSVNGVPVMDGIHYPLTNVGLQAAVNAAPAGGTVYVPPGTYALTGTGAEEILLTRSIHFVCSGWGTMLVVGSSVPKTTDVFHIKPTLGVVMQDIVIQDCFVTSAGGAPGRYGISLDTQSSSTTAVAYAKFIHNYVGNLGGNYSFAVINPPTSGNGSFWLSSFEDNYFSNGGLLFSKTGDGISVQKNQITYFNSSATSSGIELDSIAGGSHILIAFNNITTQGGCLLVHRAIQPKFMFNQCEQVVASTEVNNAMIDLAGDVHNIDSAYIVGNNLNGHGNVINNIRLDVTTNVFIEDNGIVVKDNTGMGINIGASSAGTVIGPNNFGSPVGAAVAINNNGSHTQVYGNASTQRPVTFIQPYSDAQTGLTLQENSATQLATNFAYQNSAGGNLFFLAPQTGDGVWTEHAAGGFTGLGKAACGGDSGTHTLQCSYNGDTPLSLSRVVAHGTSGLGSTLITAGACAPIVTTPATGAVSTDSVEWSFASPPATADGLLIYTWYLTSGNVNWKVCNTSAVSRIPSGPVINWVVLR